MIRISKKIYILNNDYILKLFLTCLIFNGCSIESKRFVPEQYKSGQISFHRVCAQCHGIDVMGGNRAPTFLQNKFLPDNFSNAKFAKTIINGSNSGAMPSQRKKVTDKQIKEIINYIRYTQKESSRLN
jgi:cytochrome c553